MFNLLFANAIILLCFFFLFLVTFSHKDLFIPVPIVNIKVKEEPAIPTGNTYMQHMKLYLTYQMMLTK